MDVPRLVYDLSPADVAKLLDVHEDSVRKWADAGDLASIRTPGGWRRFSRVDVELFIDRLRTSPASEATA